MMAVGFARRIIFEARPLLAPHGQVVEQFVSASVQDLPVGCEPDLVFVPHSGQHAGEPYIVEFKHTAAPIVDSAWLTAARHHRDRIGVANQGSRVWFFFATNAHVAPNQQAWCNNVGLAVVAGLAHGARVAQVLLAQAGAP